ncbi:MAG: hypothetical protein HKN87_22205 [Saprospiraceae bacterium]|nr:hypothetical protein [Saprospiraceae bacterium]
MSVILNAPAVSRFTGPACPDRHLKATQLMGADVSNIEDVQSEAGEILVDCIVSLMKKLEISNGLVPSVLPKQTLQNLYKVHFHKTGSLNFLPALQTRKI